MPEPRNAIIEELVSRNLISRENADLVMARSKADGRLPLKVLIDDRFVPEETVYRTVADAADMEYVNPDGLSVDPSASKLLSGDWAIRLHALPYAWDGDRLIVAVDDPTNLTMADDVRRITKVEPLFALAAPTQLMRRIGQVYRAEDELDDLSQTIDGASIDGASWEFDENDAGVISSNEAPVIRFVNLMIAQAVADRASDIHLEPTETDVQVRYRIDGVLHPQRSTSRGILSAVVNRIKIMSNMDIGERRVPQDGRMTVTVNGRKVDLRVATLPTVYGEKIVLRILDNAGAPIDLSDVGLSARHQEIYARHYRRPHGMILVTGPTGSGKSTTLYATLNTVKSPQTNIITVEDPVEYRMAGLNQIQINNKSGMTFASALRSILRSDPDILLIGEIRDRETANIAIEAAMTGHLVFTTLHTNDAPSAVTRLVEMGVEPYLVGTALSLVVAQRLLRRLCDRCSVEYTPAGSQLAALGFPWTPGEDLPTLRKAVGCDSCAQTGYRGRTAIHEMLEMDPRIERLASSGAHTDEIRDAAIEGNRLLLMREDGWQKVIAGHTTIEEVLRVTTG